MKKLVKIAGVVAAAAVLKCSDPLSVNNDKPLAPLSPIEGNEWVMPAAEKGQADVQPAPAAEPHPLGWLPLTETYARYNTGRGTPVGGNGLGYDIFANWCMDNTNH